MFRSTALPNIWVAGLKAEKPPFDEPGVVQEFVGRGVTTEFEIPKKAEDFTQTSVKNLLDSFERSIGPLRDTFKLKYNLLVRSPKANPLSRRAVRMRARGYVRSKNPFEPDLISVGTPTLNKDEWGDIRGDVYEVTVEVTK